MLCMYCGKLHPSLTLTGLEDHYKRECKMLIECPGCAELAETRYLKDHLLYECEKRKDFKLCDRCQQPINLNLYTKHRTSNKCKLLPPNEKVGRCLLCWEDVSPNNDIGWRKHLMQNCKSNPRIRKR